MGCHRYGLPVERIREIIRSLDTLTRIPQMPDYISGCLNLRGTVIPVVDLRTKFSANPSDEDTIDCIVVTEVHLGGGKLLTGLVVDSVDEAISLKRSDLEPAPEFGGGPDTKFISTTGKVKDRFVCCWILTV